MPTVNQILDLDSGLSKTAEQYNADLEAILSGGAGSGYRGGSLGARADALEKASHEIMNLRPQDALNPPTAEEIMNRVQPAAPPALKIAGLAGAALGTAAGAPLGPVGMVAGGMIGSHMQGKKKKKNPFGESDESEGGEKEASTDSDPVINHLLSATADQPEVNATIRKVAAYTEGRDILNESYRLGIAAAGQDIDEVQAEQPE
jgi:hypothetical protein